MVDVFFYVGNPPQWDEVPAEYEDPQARDEGTPNQHIASLLAQIEAETTSVGLPLKDVFDDAAMRENASSNGLYLTFLDTPAALQIAAKAVQHFAPKAGVQCFDPVAVGPAESFTGPDPDHDETPPTPSKVRS